jgi:hemoglobin
MIDKLYEKIGGRDVVTALVRTFYDKVQADQRLARFFQAASMDGLRSKQAMFLTMLLGGTRSFSGMDLNHAHARSREQGLTDADFDALLKLFAESLNEIHVEQEYTDEILRLLETTRGRVMGRE